MFHLFNSSFSLKKDVFPVGTLYSCLLVSEVKCSFVYDIVSLIYVTAPFFPGGFQKKTNICAKEAVNVNVSHFKKSHCVQIAKRVIFSGRFL